MNYIINLIFIFTIYDITDVSSLHAEIQYLEQFGYLPTFSDINDNGEEITNGPVAAATILRSDAAIENALAELQRIARIPITGQLDNATILLLQQPRCGMKDSELLRNSVASFLRRRRHSRETQKRRNVRINNIHAKMTVFKWPKTEITYRIENVARRVADRGVLRRIIHNAAQTWNGASALRLVESADPAAEIRISFHVGQHGDAYPFDGQGRILAHAFYPPYHNSGLNRRDTGKQMYKEMGPPEGGDIHFDDEEQWRVYNDNGGEISLQAVATHEIGHSLGLHHSDHPLSIMYPYYRYEAAPEHNNNGKSSLDKAKRSDIFQIHNYDRIMLQRLYGRTEQISAKPNTEKILTSYDHPTIPTIKKDEDIRRMKPRIGSDHTQKPSEKQTDKEVQPDPCNTKIDAISLIRNEIFMFQNKWFWRFDINGTLISRPSKIVEFWRELESLLVPLSVDALFEWNDRLFLFVGRNIAEYRENRLLSVRNLTDIGLPIEVENVRLAYNWEYGLDAKYYVWTDKLYWKIDVQQLKVELDYPRSISDNWRGVPDDVSAAFSWNKHLFFVGDSTFFKFNSYRMRLSAGYPQPFAHMLLHCMPKAEAGSTDLHGGIF